MTEMLVFQLLFPIVGTALVVSMGYLFARSIKPLGRFEKLLLLYGCVASLGFCYVASFSKEITDLTGSRDLPFLMMFGWVILVGWIAWRKHLS